MSRFRQKGTKQEWDRPELQLDISHLLLYVFFERADEVNLLQERDRFLLRPLLNQCDDGQCFLPRLPSPCFIVSNNHSNCSRNQKRGGDKDSRKPSSKTRWERKKEKLEADLL